MQAYGPLCLAQRARRIVFLCAFFAAALFATHSAGAQDVTTHHYTNDRQGVQTQETALTPSNLNYAAFGKVFSFPVLGDVYAQPLFLKQYTMADGQPHNVLFVATQEDYVYAFDADGNNPAQGYLWRASLLGTGETWGSKNDVGSLDISPNIGITGTPVVDRTRGALYVVAKSKNRSGAVQYFQRLHALRLSDGSEVLNGPTLIQATVNGSGNGGTTVSFDPLRGNQRPGLLLASTPNGTSTSTVFIGWASHGDQGLYHGWIIGYNAADISQQTAVWTDTPNGTQGGIWMGAGGIAGDAAGNIFAAAGNGTFDANVGGPDYGDSAFRLTMHGTNLAAADYFTPADQSSLNSDDKDLGTGAVVLLPNQGGAIPHLAVTVDKSGTIYLLNRDNLGGYGTPTNSSVQSFGDGGFGIHNSAAFFNNTLYLGADGASIQAWTLNPSTGLFSTSPQSKSNTAFGCSNDCDGAGSTVSISANGAANGIVWALDNSGFGVSAAVLHAYDAANLATELYNSTQAANSRDAAAVAVKFTTPTVANGRAYIGGRNAVSVYGPLSTTQITAAPAFSPGGGSYTGAQAVTISDSTANASIYYTTDGSTPSTGSALYTAPIQVTASETLQAIAIAPGYAESPVALAAYTIASSATTGGQGVVSYGSGFAASSLALNGTAKLNGSRLQLTNAGGGIYQAASAWFPAPVNVQSFTNDFSFQLTSAVADGFTFTIQNSGTTAVDSAGGGGLGYGPVAKTGAAGIGHSVAVKFDLYNNAGEGVDSTGLYTNGASPTTPAIDLSSTGVNLKSGDIMQVHMVYDGVTLTVTIVDQTTNASATQKYTVDIPTVTGGPTALIGFTGGTGKLLATQEILSWVYAPTPYYPAGFTSSAGLALNGVAAVSAPRLRLTNGGSYQTASAWFPTTVNVANFTSNFTFQLTNPVADGFTFVIQNAGTKAVDGEGGGGLGYGPVHLGGTPGIKPSVAVKFDLYNNAGEGVDSTGIYTNGVSPSTPATDLSSTGIDLHSGDVFAVSMAYSGAVLTVTITDTKTNATATQSYSVNIPSVVGSSYAYVGFTAGAGKLSATQEILGWQFQ